MAKIYQSNQNLNNLRGATPFVSQPAAEPIVSTFENKENTMNNNTNNANNTRTVITIDARIVKTFEITSVVWMSSAWRESDGTVNSSRWNIPSMVAYYPSGSKIGDKKTQLHVTEDGKTITECSAMAGAALRFNTKMVVATAEFVTGYTKNEKGEFVKVLDENGKPVGAHQADEMTLAEFVKPANHDESLYFPVTESGAYNSAWMFYPVFRPSFGDGLFGVAHSSGWKGNDKARLIKTLVRDNGTKIDLDCEIERPIMLDEAGKEVKCFWELRYNVVDEEVTISPIRPMPGESKQYREEFYKAIRLLASGEAFKVDSLVTHRQSNDRDDKSAAGNVQKMIAYSTMTSEQILADKFARKEKKEEYGKMRQARQMGEQSGKFAPVNETVAEDGTVLHRAAGKSFTLMVNGKPTTLTSALDLPEGEYGIYKTGRNSKFVDNFTVIHGATAREIRPSVEFLEGLTNYNIVASDAQEDILL